VTDISDVVLAEAAVDVTFTDVLCPISKMLTGHAEVTIGAVPRQLHPNVQIASDRRSPGKSRS
jgi:metal-sulfur cluster biosynthetic enzyme